MTGNRPPTDIVAWMRERRPAASAPPRRGSDPDRRVPPPLDWRPWDLVATGVAAALLLLAVAVRIAGMGGTAPTPPPLSLPPLSLPPQSPPPLSPPSAPASAPAPLPSVPAPQARRPASPPGQQTVTEPDLQRVK